MEHVLPPTLVPGTIVILDNQSAHKRERVRLLIEAYGCELWVRPAYFPDLSPIAEAAPTAT